MTTDPTSVNGYADKIMEMIDDDMHGLAAEGDLKRANGLAAAQTFSDLHDFVDANEYMIHADVPYEPDDESVMRFYVDVQDEVTRRLAARPTSGKRAYAIDVHDSYGASTRYEEEAASAVEALRAAADQPLREFIVDIGDQRLTVNATSDADALRLAAAMLD